MANNTRFSADLTKRAHEWLDYINDKYPQEICDAIRSVIIYNPDFHHEAPAAVLAANEVSTFIAGAWGCGVFRQDPEFMAKAMIEELTYPQTLVFAIPKGRNYDAFDKVLKEVYYT